MKTKILIFFICINSISFFVFSTNYYVSGGGNDSNDGLTIETAFRNIQKGADLVLPGDTVFVANGIYNNQVGYNNGIIISKSGKPKQWIVFKNYLDHKPKVIFNTWFGINIAPNTSYIEINGFEIEGNNKNIILDDAIFQNQGCKKLGKGEFEAKYNGNGISIDERFNNTESRSHHINIKNCAIHDCGGAGISAIQCDYITIRNNRVYNNSWYTIFGASGISLYQLWNSDSDSTSTKNIIENNICFKNMLLVPWAFGDCMFTDGNGIIIDDTRNTQNNSKLKPYSGKTLIKNNIVYNNGGSGIHTYESDHVTITNNTAYKNSQTEEIDGGEIFANTSGDIKIINNILFANDNNAINSNYNTTNLIYENNLHWNGSKTVVTSASCITANPLFVDEEKFDFHLKNNSPAKNSGNMLIIDKKNIDGNTNPNKINIGAF